MPGPAFAPPPAPPAPLPTHLLTLWDVSLRGITTVLVLMPVSVVAPLPSEAILAEVLDSSPLDWRLHGVLWVSTLARGRVSQIVCSVWSPVPATVWLAAETE